MAMLDSPTVLVALTNYNLLKEIIAFSVTCSRKNTHKYIFFLRHKKLKFKSCLFIKFMLWYIMVCIVRASLLFPIVYLLSVTTRTHCLFGP